MRVENLGKNVDEWYAKNRGDGSSTHDVCRGCANRLEKNPHAFDDKLKPYNGDPQGDEGWGGDVDHPPYDDDPGSYKCAACGKKLTDGRD